MQVRHILENKGRDVITVASNATLEEVARILSDNRIGALLVKGKNGALAGIIGASLWVPNAQPAPIRA